MPAFGLHWFKHSGKTGLAVVLTFLTCMAGGATELENAWAVISVFLILDPDRHTSIYASKMRIIGTIYGGFIAILLLWIMPHYQLAWIIFDIFILGCICGKLYEINAALRTTGITASILFIMGMHEKNAVILALHRLEYIVIAVVITLLISFMSPDKK